jgi:hypothetical protein
MALKVLDRDADLRFGLEDVFTDGGADKRAWASGLRKLPHVRPEVAKLYAYPQWFAEQIYARIERALDARVAESAARPAVITGRLFVLPAAADPAAGAKTARVEDLAVRFVKSSDSELVAAGRALACDEAQLSSERQEGHFLASFETANGWTAISKDVLTEVLGAGRDAKIAGLPAAAVERLCLLGRDLVALDGH